MSACTIILFLWMSVFRVLEVALAFHLVPAFLSFPKFFLLYQCHGLGHRPSTYQSSSQCPLQVFVYSYVLITN